MPFNQFMLERSIQEQIDRKMCRPGWTYNKTLKECLPAAVGYVEKPEPKPEPGPDLPDSGENDENSADKAVKMEVAMRKSQGLRPNK